MAYVCFNMYTYIFLIKIYDLIIIYIILSMYEKRKVL